MNTTQVLSSDIFSLAVATKQDNNYVAPSLSTSSSLTLNSNKENNLTAPAPVYSRVITKESLLLQADVSLSSCPSNDAEDENSFHSPLFEFSLLEPDFKEAELLALPLTAIELPLTPPPFENTPGNSFDSAAATLLTPVVSESDCSSSLVLSTAAAIAARQPTTANNHHHHQKPALPSGFVSIPAPPIASVVAAPAPAPAVALPVISPKPKRARSNSKAGSKSLSSKKKAAKLQQLKAAASHLPAVPLLTPRSSSAIATQRVTTIMEPQQQQPLLQAAVPAPRPAAPAAAVPRPAAVATHTAGGQPLPPRKFVPPPGSAPPPPGAMVASAHAYHHHHAAHPAAQHPQANARAAAAARARTPPNAPQPGSSNNQANNVNNTAQTNSNISPTTGQVENTGRWTAEEHRLFLQGLEQHGKGWKKIATLIKSRTVVQIRTHAQKYFQKLAKARQSGEAVPGLGHVGGQVVQTVVPGMPVMASTGENVQVELGITVPVGPDGQPVVAMRTASHPNGSVVHHHHGASGNMSIGSDAASIAAQSGNVGIATAGGVVVQAAPRGGRKRRSPQGNGTKRRAIGNVVRSAVREGRNVKRQKVAEVKRKGRANSLASAPVAAAPAPARARAQSVAVKASSNEEVYEVPNPLPAVSNVLDPYVATTTMGMPPPPVPSAGNPAGVKNKGRGRQQLVQTATHGALPMAALEDAVFRLLTPATGAPTPQVQGAPHPAPVASNGIIDPLAPAPVTHAKIPVAHTQYHPAPPSSAPMSGMYPQGIVLNSSPTGVADMSLLPSWVDAKNPPAWYNDGSDIDTLLEDAECLNWLSDTGDLEETYPPAMAEPAAVVSSASTTVVPAVEPTPVLPVQDPTGGVVHPSAESLSFLVDLHEQPVSAPVHVAPVVGVPLMQQIAEVPAHHVEMHHLPTFLDEAGAGAPVIFDETLANPFASATEAAEAAIPEHKLAGMGGSDTNLMGFPDLDMGDEQAFVSALLENSGQSTMSFPKLGSEMHLGGHQSGLALSGVQSGVGLKEEVLDETA